MVLGRTALEIFGENMVKWKKYVFWEDSLSRDERMDWSFYRLPRRFTESL